MTIISHFFSEFVCPQEVFFLSVFLKMMRVVLKHVHLMTLQMAGAGFRSVAISRHQFSSRAFCVCHQGGRMREMIMKVIVTILMVVFLDKTTQLSIINRLQSKNFMLPFAGINPLPTFLHQHLPRIHREQFPEIPGTQFL